MWTYSALKSQVQTVAAPPPTPRSMAIATSGVRMCSAAAGSRSANICSSAKSSTPPMATRARAGSNPTPARPATATMRPQFGSPPWTAVLTSGELAMARAARRASASLSAPVTLTETSLVAPSPPLTTASASSWQTAWRASTNAG